MFGKYCLIPLFAWDERESCSEETVQVFLMCTQLWLASYIGKQSSQNVLNPRIGAILLGHPSQCVELKFKRKIPKKTVIGGILKR